MENMPEGFVYIEDVLREGDEQMLLQQLSTLGYQHDQFRGKLLKRSAAHFGFAYRATGRRLVPTEALPGFLSSVIDVFLPYCPQESEFNQCLVTRYPPGAGIGWHVDAPQFGDCIVGVNLKNPARLLFRPATQAKSSSAMTVTPRSVYVMSGSARWRYEHRVMPVQALRYSLTFRSVVSMTQEVCEVETTHLHEVAPILERLERLGHEE